MIYKESLKFTRSRNSLAMTYMHKNYKKKFSFLSKFWLHTCLGLVLLASIQTVKAQLPQTRIYLFDLQRSQKGMKVSNGHLISKNKGYNNQPSFSPDSRYLYFSSSIDSTNTELFKMDLEKKKPRLVRLTKTKEPEYSPKITPDMDRISCVSVERDTVTQHLYTLNLKGKKPQVVLPQLKTIGYYEWITSYEFVSFELPEPFYLVKHNLNFSKVDTMATQIGRTFFYYRSKGRIVYVDKSDSLHWKIKTLNPNPKKNPEPNNTLCETLPGEEDFCILMDGSLLQGHQGVLYYLKNPFRFQDSKWEPLIDMNQFGFKKFQRLAVSYDNTKLAVVALP